MSLEDKLGPSGARALTKSAGQGWRGVTAARQHGWLLGPLLLLCCAPEASRTPLSPPVVPKHDVYFYGPAEVSRDRTPPPKPAPAPTPRQNESRKAASNTDADASAPGHQADAKLDEPTPTRADGDPATQDRSGTYQGSDRVTIRFEGLPEQTQDDDRAKVRVEVVDAEKQRHAVSVLDSNSGKPLCTVEGELEQNHIDFASAQPCFSGILGAPVDASLIEGRASFEGSTLRLELDVALELAAPEATLDGSLKYSFEGER